MGKLKRHGAPLLASVVLASSLFAWDSTAAESPEQLRVCNSKASEAAAAYDAADLEHYNRLSAQAEKLCAKQFTPEMMSAFARDRGSLLMGVRDYDGARKEYERCISMFYNERFCHLGLITAFQGMGQGAAAAKQVTRTIKVIDHLIEEHDIAMVGVSGSSKLIQLAKRERDLLVALKEQAEHALDPPPSLLEPSGPSKPNSKPGKADQGS